MAFCPICEKKFQDRRGLHGHFRFFHGIEYGSGKPAKKTALTEAIGRDIRRRGEGGKLMKEIEAHKEGRQKPLELEESLGAYPKKEVLEGVDLGGVEIKW